MGMYNEVYKRCPNCGTKAIMQVSQYAFGFGCFDLDDLSTLSELNEEDMIELKKEIIQGWWFCENDNCYRNFNPYREIRDREQVTLAERLFSI